MRNGGTYHVNAWTTKCWCWSYPCWCHGKPLACVCDDCDECNNRNAAPASKITPDISEHLALTVADIHNWTDDELSAEEIAKLVEEFTKLVDKAFNRKGKKNDL